MEYIGTLYNLHTFTISLNLFKKIKMIKNRTAPQGLWDCIGLSDMSVTGVPEVKATDSWAENDLKK